MAYETIRHQVAAKTYFGALLKHSVVDLAAYLILDIKEALNKGKSVATLFLDIKGAFNIVNYLKLFRRFYL